LNPSFSEVDLVRSITKQSFFEFLKEFWDVEDPVWNWHVEYLCNELQEVAERVFAGKPKDYDLIINISEAAFLSDTLTTRRLVFMKNKSRLKTKPKDQG
jgi:hypothetical protein